MDSSITVRSLIQYLLTTEEVDGVAVTDHDTLQGYHRLLEAFPKGLGWLIIPGVEVTLNEGHLILLGVEEEPALSRPTLEAALKFSEEHGCVTVAPHPYRVDGIGDLVEEAEVESRTEEPDADIESELEE